MRHLRTDLACLVLLASFSAAFGSNLGCSKQESKKEGKSDDPSTTSTPSPTDGGDPTPTESSSPSAEATATPGTPSGGGSGVDTSTLRTSFASCIGQNKTWRASVNNSAPGCGGTIATWCCSQAELARRFPSATDFNSGIASYISQGYILHHCSEDNVTAGAPFGTWTAHLAKIDTRISSKSFTITGYNPVAGTDTCAAVTIDQILANAVEVGGGSGSGATDDSELEVGEDDGG